MNGILLINISIKQSFASIIFTLPEKGPSSSFSAAAAGVAAAAALFLALDLAAVSPFLAEVAEGVVAVEAEVDSFAYFERQRALKQNIWCTIRQKINQRTD